LLTARRLDLEDVGSEPAEELDGPWLTLLVGTVYTDRRKTREQ